ncbi:uncharacterized protein LOC134219095 [Armigeres subalbatus]|uniref:uncharacterized protein LOC134219095 n=1 Tax=Armigeres subalbatus TaxID=124917 RepID=UPI002ED480A9
MYKLFVFSCLIAAAVAAPAPGVVLASPVVHAPVVHAVHAAPVAVSHSSSHVVHHAPVVKHAVVAHASPVVAVHHAPVLTKTVVVQCPRRPHSSCPPHPVLAKTVAAPVVHAAHPVLKRSSFTTKSHPHTNPQNLRNRTKTRQISLETESS